MREEELRVARRAEVEPRDLGNAHGVERLLGCAPEVELAVAHDRHTETVAKPGGDVVADLVAARADSGPDHRGEASSVQRGRSRLDDSLEQAAPAHVDGRDRGLLALPAHERDRQAVGREDEQGLAGHVRPEAVAGFPLAVRPAHDRPVHLPAEAK